MKTYLLIAGSSYYPDFGTGDWVRAFETEKNAEDVVETIEHHNFYTKGKNKGEIKSTSKSYKINDQIYDWYEIIDLKKWIFP